MLGFCEGVGMTAHPENLRDLLILQVRNISAFLFGVGFVVGLFAVFSFNVMQVKQTKDKEQKRKRKIYTD